MSFIGDLEMMTWKLKIDIRFHIEMKNLSKEGLIFNFDTICMYQELNFLKSLKDGSFFLDISAEYSANCT